MNLRLAEYKGGHFTQHIYDILMLIFFTKKHRIFLLQNKTCTDIYNFLYYFYTIFLFMLTNLSIYQNNPIKNVDAFASKFPLKNNPHLVEFLCHLSSKR